MSSNASSGDIPEEERPSGDSPNPSGTSTNTSGGMQAVINHITSDKIEAAMWISRLTTIVFTISFVLPFFG